MAATVADGCVVSSEPFLAVDSRVEQRSRAEGERESEWEKRRSVY